MNVLVEYVLIVECGCDAVLCGYRWLFFFSCFCALELAVDVCNKIVECGCDTVLCEYQCFSFFLLLCFRGFQPIITS